MIIQSCGLPIKRLRQLIKIVLPSAKNVLMSQLKVY